MIERNAHRRKFKVGDSWRMDETYVRVSGKDRYLYRAVDKSGATVDFLLTKRRMKGSAQKFLNKVLSNNPKPRVINIDKSGANTAGILTINKRSIWSTPQGSDTTSQVPKQYHRARSQGHKAPNINNNGVQRI